MVKKFEDTFSLFVLTEFMNVTDRRTDGRADGQTDAHRMTAYRPRLHSFVRQKLNEKRTKNKPMSIISPMQSNDP